VTRTLIHPFTHFGAISSSSSIMVPLSTRTTRTALLLLVLVVLLVVVVCAVVAEEPLADSSTTITTPQHDGSATLAGSNTTTDEHLSGCWSTARMQQTRCDRAHSLSNSNRALTQQLPRSITSMFDREQVREMFYHAYNGYMQHAFPMDELRPMSCSGWDTLGGYKQQRHRALLRRWLLVLTHARYAWHTRI